MTISGWLVFAGMAILWGGLTRTAEHYAAVILNTYRARRIEKWVEYQVRRVLQ